MPHLRGGHWPSSALHPSGGRSAPPPPGGFCGTVVPAAPDMRGGLAPSSALLPCMGAPPHAPGVFAGLVVPAPTCRRSALHPGDFPVAGKVTKGAPRAAPFGIPRCVVAALFALAYASRRATFCHKNRPICHFELVGKSVLFFPLVSSREHSLFSIRGSAGLPPRMLEGLSHHNQYR